MKFGIKAFLGAVAGVAMLATSSPSFARDDWNGHGWRGNGWNNGHGWKHGHGNHGWDGPRGNRGNKNWSRNNVTIINNGGGHVVYPGNVYPPVQRIRYSTPPAYYSSTNYSSISCGSGTNTLGTILGGAGGGLIGTQIGKGHGRDAAMIGGAILGSLVGASHINLNDRDCVSQVVTSGPVGTPVAWRNPQNDYDYRVIPTREWENAGRYCREYQAVATVGGRYQETYGTACYQPDGSWEIVR